MSQWDAVDEPVRHRWLCREEVLEQFESAWRDGAAPPIRDFLPAAGDENRLPLLLELIKIDLEYRWGRGERRRIEEYAREFPELGEPVALPLDLIAEEIRVRRQFRAPAATASELSERFPGRSAELSRCIATIERPDRGVELPSADRESRGGHDDSREQFTGPAKPGSVRDNPGSATAPGQRLGRYELGQYIGHGAFATVYRALDVELGRVVAVKIPRPEFMDEPGARERVHREAASAARLRHPGIVPIHEVGRDGDRMYIVYDFIPGPTLAELMRGTRPAPQQAAEWVARIAEALDYAHQCGIVHRDVKPSNVMMDRTGAPVLADFGLALQRDATATLTQQGDILGTPAYMAPEQARGEGHQADARTDVYSLGVLLYELLSGRPPFQGTGATVLHSVMYEEPEPPRRSRIGIAPDLETICLKAMAKEPARRYATAGALADDLWRYLNHRPIRARRAGPLGRAALWCRRKPALALTIAAALIVSSAVAGASFHQIIAERNRAEEHLYRALVDGARAQLDGRRTGWWWHAMENVRQAARLPVVARDETELRELAIECLVTSYPSFRLNSQWTGHTGAVTAVALSPTGRWTVSGSHDGSVRVWSMPDGRPAAVFTDHADAVTGVALSTRGGHLASSSMDGSIRVRELTERGGAASDPIELRLQAGPIRGIAFSADGRWLAAGTEDGRVWMLATEKPAFSVPPRAFSRHDGPVICVAFSSTGNMLASASEDKTIRLWSLPGGELIDVVTLDEPARTLAFLPNQDVVLWARHENYGFGYRWSQSHREEHAVMHHGPIWQLCGSDKGRVLTAGGDGRIKLWSLHGYPREVAVAEGDFGAVRSLAQDAATRWVVAGYRDGTIRLWELNEPTHRILGQVGAHAAVFGRQRKLFETRRVSDFLNWSQSTARGVSGPGLHAGLVWGIALSGDERRIATAGSDKKVKLWSAPDMRWEQTLEGHHDLVWCIAFSPDSQRIASGSEWAKPQGIVGEIKVWDAAAGDEIFHLEGHRRQVVALAYHPSQPWLVSGSLDGSVLLWNANTGQLLGSVYQSDRPVHQLAFRGDGRWLAAAYHDQPVMLWNETSLAAWVRRRERAASDDPGGSTASDEAPLAPDRSLASHTGSVWSVTFSRDGQYLAAGSDDGMVVLWSGNSFDRVVTIRGSTVRIRSLTFSHDTELLAAAALNADTAVWNLGQIRATLDGLNLNW